MGGLPNIEGKTTLWIGPLNTVFPPGIPHLTQKHYTGQIMAPLPQCDQLG
jgi:hypothetical protein